MLIYFFGFPTELPCIARKFAPTQVIGEFRKQLVDEITASNPAAGASIVSCFLYAVQPDGKSYLLQDTSTFDSVEGIARLVLFKVS